MEYRIHLDMDGVLCNFDKGAIAVHGMDFAEVTAKRPPGHWSLVEPMGFTSTNQFWKPINEAGVDFWTNLEPLPWMDELVKLVSTITEDWYIVTAPSYDIDSYIGKLTWIKNMFGRKFTRVVPTMHKEILAGNRTILIDDRYENCNKFYQECLERQYQGAGSVIFPSIGNDFHEHAHDPIPLVKESLLQMIGVKYAS